MLRPLNQQRQQRIPVRILVVHQNPLLGRNGERDVFLDRVLVAVGQRSHIRVDDDLRPGVAVLVDQPEHQARGAARFEAGEINAQFLARVLNGRLDVQAVFAFGPVEIGVSPLPERGHKRLPGFIQQGHLKGILDEALAGFVELRIKLESQPRRVRRDLDLCFQRHQVRVPLAHHQERVALQRLRIAVLERHVSPEALAAAELLDGPSVQARRALGDQLHLPAFHDPRIDDDPVGHAVRIAPPAVAQKERQHVAADHGARIAVEDEGHEPLRFRLQLVVAGRNITFR